MKNNNVILLYLSLILITSCNSGSKIRIGFMTPNLKDDRYKKEQVFFGQKIKELGAEPLVASANDDDKLQIRQAIDMINQGVEVLVVDAVNLNTAALIVREAHKKNVTVIAYDRLIQNADLDYYLSFDNEKVGELMAEYAIKNNTSGNYILLGGDKADKNAIMVKSGQLKALDSSIKDGKIKVVYDVFIENWSYENAYEEINSYLNMCQEIPNAILASNDGMARGAAQAIKEHGLSGKILVTGQDAELAACKNIVSGLQAMTVYKSFKNQAYTAAALAFKCAKGEKITEAKSTVFNGRIEVPAILIKPTPVDKSNLRATVIADGVYSESEIFN